MIDIGMVIIIAALTFFVGLFLGVFVLGLAMAASREDDSRGR